MNEMMSIQEVAKYLSMSPMWVRMRIKEGKIKAINMSNGQERKHFRVRREDLEEFING